MTKKFVDELETSYKDYSSKFDMARKNVKKNVNNYSYDEIDSYETDSFNIFDPNKHSVSSASLNKSTVFCDSFEERSMFYESECLLSFKDIDEDELKYE